MVIQTCNDLRTPVPAESRGHFDHILSPSPVAGGLGQTVECATDQIARLRLANRGSTFELVLPRVRLNTGMQIVCREVSIHNMESKPACCGADCEGPCI